MTFKKYKTLKAYAKIATTLLHCCWRPLFTEKKRSSQITTRNKSINIYFSTACVLGLFRVVK